MSGRPVDLVLDLGTVAEHCRLLPDTCRSLAAAATVTLERVHGVRTQDACRIEEGDTHRGGVLLRTEISDDARATYDSPAEATEEGAEAVAILVARRVLDRVVVRRLDTYSGADYVIRDPANPDLEQYERLECSGIAKGRESTISRLQSKIAQLAAVTDRPPGYAVVTNFRTSPLEIAVGRCE